jgi:hypothetical protein
MWCVTVAVGTIPWALMFKTEEAARKAYEVACLRGLHTNQLRDTQIEIDDDFGQNLSVQVTSVAGCMLEDMDKSKLAHIERALHHARMQQEGQKLAQADATLRQGQHGPSIISPMGMPNGYPRQ